MGARGGNGAVLIASGHWDAAPWADALKRLDPARPVHVWPDVDDPAAIRYAMVWHPPAGALSGLPNLAAIFALGAGVDYVVPDDSLPDVPLVRIVDADLTMRMTEWVVLQVLMHHRRQREYDRLQAARRWKEIDQPPASSVRVGIMGLGVLGRDAAEVLARIGFRVAGWSRRAKSMPGIATYHGPDGLDAMLRRTDILVCLLPLTPATRGILNRDLFLRLPRDGALGGPVLVNAGRGGLQVEADILAALDEGALAAASLDVFETEPLPETSPLWTHPDVVVTPHVAGASDPDTLTAVIHRQIVAFEAGRPLENVVDRERGY
jgi:glyoxylate/hydroxypyruvate reductase